MMQIDHIALAVADMQEALQTFKALYGLEPESLETVESEKITEAMLPAGDACIQLLEATDDSSTVAKFIAKRGPGLHHIAIRVPDLAAAMKRVSDAGGQLLDETPRIGGGGHQVAFVHPKSNGGVLIELIQQ